MALHRYLRYFPDTGAPLIEQCVTWHDQVLADNWDAIVDKDDQVWVLGDICLGGTASRKRALEWVKARPGTKHLISGNHDDCHPMHRNSHTQQPVYLDAFASVQMAAKKRIPLEEGHLTVFLSHFPYRADRGPFARHLEWRLVNAGVILLHGHTHSEEKISYDTSVWDPQLKTPQIHVGLDAWDLRPVPFDKVKELVLQVAGVNENQGSQSLASSKGGDRPE